MTRGRPQCDCGQLSAPLWGVGRNGLGYRIWACSYWPRARCAFRKVRRQERGTV